MASLAYVGGGILLVAGKYWINGTSNQHYPALDDKIIVVTGANAGLGYINVEVMAKLNPKMVILACRDETRGPAAVEKLKSEHGLENIMFMQLDLNDLGSVKKFCDEFNQKFDKLDILVNNAGIYGQQERSETVQGYEKQFGVNHLGHFALT